MEILKHGNIHHTNLPDEILTFICHECGCIFRQEVKNIPTSQTYFNKGGFKCASEYGDARVEDTHLFFVQNCPECGIRVGYSYYLNEFRSQKVGFFEALFKCQE